MLSEVVGLARDLGVDLIGEPRLVRLNPNIPWKTRGNAALGARFGHGRGRRRRVGEVGGRGIWGYEAGGPLSSQESGSFRAAAWERVLANASVGEPGTDPAMVVSSHRLPGTLYWRAVREVVPVDAVRQALDLAGAWWRTHGSERGLVGAAAAIAWPGRRATWELTTYRRPERQGTPRQVDRASVRRAAARWPSLFLCEDRRTRRLLVAPHTACPVLYGLRADRPAGLSRALRVVRSEPVDRWMRFCTNQASGDHLVVRSGASLLGPYESGRLRVTVRAPPRDLPGGHVALSTRAADGSDLACLAFEPTKTLPRVVRALVPGDRLLVWGSRGADPTFRLEGLRLLRLAPRRGPPRAPACDRCGRPTRSLGRSRGYRCPGCHHRLPPEKAVRPRRVAPLSVKEYHPTPSARRHLAPRAPDD